MGCGTHANKRDGAEHAREQTGPTSTQERGASHEVQPRQRAHVAASIPRGTAAARCTSGRSTARCCPLCTTAQGHAARTESAQIAAPHQGQPARNSAGRARRRGEAIDQVPRTDQGYGQPAANEVGHEHGTLVRGFTRQWCRQDREQMGSDTAALRQPSQPDQCEAGNSAQAGSRRRNTHRQRSKVSGNEMCSYSRQFSVVPPLGSLAPKLTYMPV